MYARRSFCSRMPMHCRSDITIVPSYRSIATNHHLYARRKAIAGCIAFDFALFSFNPLSNRCLFIPLCLLLISRPMMAVECRSMATICCRFIVVRPSIDTPCTVECSDQNRWHQVENPREPHVSAMLSKGLLRLFWVFCRRNNKAAYWDLHVTTNHGV